MVAWGLPRLSGSSPEALCPTKASHNLCPTKAPTRDAEAAFGFGTKDYWAVIGLETAQKWNLRDRVSQSELLSSVTRNNANCLSSAQPGKKSISRLSTLLVWAPSAVMGYSTLPVSSYFHPLPLLFGAYFAPGRPSKPRQPIEIINVYPAAKQATHPMSCLLSSVGNGT